MSENDWLDGLRRQKIKNFITDTKLNINSEELLQRLHGLDQMVCYRSLFGKKFEKRFEAMLTDLERDIFYWVLKTN